MSYYLFGISIICIIRQHCIVLNLIPSKTSTHQFEKIIMLSIVDPFHKLYLLK